MQAQNVGWRQERSAIAYDRLTGGCSMRKLLGSIAAILFMVGTAEAQLVRGQDVNSVAQALRGMGYQAEVTKDESGDPMIKSASSGTSFAIFFFGCTKNVDCRTIQFFAGFADKKPALSLINDWNANKRFGRAYLSDKGTARIEMDLDLDDGGLSTKLFEDNVEFWVLLMSRFEKHIDG